MKQGMALEELKEDLEKGVYGLKGFGYDDFTITRSSLERYINYGEGLTFVVKGLKSNYFVLLSLMKRILHNEPEIISDREFEDSYSKFDKLISVQEIMPVIDINLEQNPKKEKEQLREMTTVSHKEVLRRRHRAIIARKKLIKKIQEGEITDFKRFKVSSRNLYTLGNTKRVLRERDGGNILDIMKDSPRYMGRITDSIVEIIADENPTIIVTQPNRKENRGVRGRFSHGERGI